MRRRERVDFWLSLALLPALLGGFVISRHCVRREGRTSGVARAHLQWSPSSCPGAAGCSLLLLAAHASRRASVCWRACWPCSLASRFFRGVGEILALRTPYLSVHRYARALLDGPWNSFFWRSWVCFSGRDSQPGHGVAEEGLHHCCAPRRCSCARPCFLSASSCWWPGRRTVWGCPGQRRVSPTSIEWSVLVG